MDGIEVYLHWSWLLVAYWQIAARTPEYSSVVWNVVEYLTLFSIVLLHEFGHSFATRQVGGTANQILLWPLGGVAYVSPPQRPGAVLWSIAAGPLVNAVLFVVLSVGVVLELSVPALRQSGMPDVHVFLHNIWLINCGILIFNLLPIYPLDGGQILRALLWFPLGRARSLFGAVMVGFAGVLGLVALAFYLRSVWIGIIGGFVFLQCNRALKQARLMGEMERAPKRTDRPCPSCGEAPPIGPYWLCPRCRTAFDAFETDCTCPACDWHEDEIQCLTCRKNPSLEEWQGTATAPVER